MQSRQEELDKVKQEKDKLMLVKRFVQRVQKIDHLVSSKALIVAMRELRSIKGDVETQLKQQNTQGKASDGQHGYLGRNRLIKQEDRQSQSDLEFQDWVGRRIAHLQRAIVHEYKR